MVSFINVVVWDVGMFRLRCSMRRLPMPCMEKIGGHAAPQSFPLLVLSPMLYSFRNITAH